MGIITRSAANNITTSGVILPAGINDASVASVTGLAQVSAGDGITLISSQTASSSASISFTGIDSTYRTYLFKFINIHPSVDEADFLFNGSTDGGSSYNVTKTTTTFYAYHTESDSTTGFTYEAGHDIAQGTGYCQIGGDAIGSDNDQSCSGYLHLFNPSSTTFVKHFIVNTNTVTYSDYSVNQYTAGYMNTVSAVNAISFQMDTGNIDAGTILMYGIA
jgi:hypothetical protein